MRPLEVIGRSDGELERTVTRTKTVRMTVETETLMIVRRAKAVSAWCPHCRDEVAVITVNIDGARDAITAAQIREWLDRGKLHWWQPAKGPAQICVPSLLQGFESQQLQEFLKSQGNSL
jgi:hypothetical protein